MNETVDFKVRSVIEYELTIVLLFGSSVFKYCEYSVLNLVSHCDVFLLLLYIVCELVVGSEGRWAWGVYGFLYDSYVRWPSDLKSGYGPV